MFCYCYVCYVVMLCVTFCYVVILRYLSSLNMCSVNGHVCYDFLRESLNKPDFTLTAERKELSMIKNMTVQQNIMFFLGADDTL